MLSFKVWTTTVGGRDSPYLYFKDGKLRHREVDSLPKITQLVLVMLWLKPR